MYLVLTPIRRSHDLTQAQIAMAVNALSMVTQCASCKNSEEIKRVLLSQAHNVRRLRPEGPIVGVGFSGGAAKYTL